MINLIGPAPMELFAGSLLGDQFAARDKFAY